MPIFQVASKQLVPVPETTFGAEGILERRDLQAMLRSSIAVLESALDDHLLVIAEEFGDWLDSSRRIDLLCLDIDANLVVIELKRTEDGGHMELQALRYAAMVSTMTFDQLVETFARHRQPTAPDIESAQKQILDFLGWGEILEDQFPQDTRIVLAAADFGKELTTAVMWLIDRAIDIRCVRMRPHRMTDGTILVDVQQLIPLPETSNFQTQIGVKKLAERKNRSQRHELRMKFWEGLLAHASTKTSVHANRKATGDGWIYAGAGRYGFSFGYTARRDDSQVELWIAHGAGQGVKNKSAFNALRQQSSAIESDFGNKLDWQELPEAEGCRIRYVVPGGYNSPQEEWHQIFSSLADAMVKLDKAMRSRIAHLAL